MAVSRLTRELWRDTPCMWLSTGTAQKIEDESSGIYDSADTGYLYIEDDDPDNELWLKLSDHMDTSIFLVYQCCQYIPFGS